MRTKQKKVDTHPPEFKYVEEVLIFQHELEQGIPVEAQSLLDFLSGWLFKHIQRVDQELGDYLRLQQTMS